MLRRWLTVALVLLALYATAPVAAQRNGLGIKRRHKYRAVHTPVKLDGDGEAEAGSEPKAEGQGDGEAARAASQGGDITADAGQDGVAAIANKKEEYDPAPQQLLDSKQPDVWLYSLLAADYEAAQLLPHFLKHYTSLGIPKHRMLLVVNHNAQSPGVPHGSLQAVASVLAAWKLDYTLWLGQYSVDAHLAFFLQQLQKVPVQDWVVLAEADELQEYSKGRSAAAFLASVAAEGGANYVLASHTDRLAEDGALRPVQADEPLDSQFPLQCRVSDSEQGGEGGTAKKRGGRRVAAFRAYLRPGVGMDEVIPAFKAKRYFGSAAASDKGDSTSSGTSRHAYCGGSDLFDLTPYANYSSFYRQGYTQAKNPYLWHPKPSSKQTVRVHHFKWRQGLDRSLADRLQGYQGGGGEGGEAGQQQQLEEGGSCTTTAPGGMPRLTRLREVAWHSRLLQQHGGTLDVSGLKCKRWRGGKPVAPVGEGQAVVAADQAAAAAQEDQEQSQAEEQEQQPRRQQQEDQPQAQEQVQQEQPQAQQQEQPQQQPQQEQAQQQPEQQQEVATAAQARRRRALLQAADVSGGTGRGLQYDVEDDAHDGADGYGGRGGRAGMGRGGRVGRRSGGRRRRRRRGGGGGRVRRRHRPAGADEEDGGGADKQAGGTGAGAGYGYGGEADGGGGGGGFFGGWGRRRRHGGGGGEGIARGRAHGGKGRPRERLYKGGGGGGGVPKHRRHRRAGALDQ